MSTLKVNKLRDTAGSADAITLDPNGGAVLAGVTTVSTVKVGSGVTISSDGDVFTTGITTSSTVIVGSGVTISESGIEASGIGITVANINGGQIGGRRNLVINGAAMVAQRGASGAASAGYYSVDRFQLDFGSGTDENPSQSQSDVASGTTPYTEGFRKALKITNGNQTTSVASNTGLYFQVLYKFESQDIAKSGWNYTNPNSFITLSFWVKSSVAQEFYARLQTTDGTSYNYPFSLGSLSADTWTKVVKTIPGNSNLQFDNNVEQGLAIEWVMYRGTGKTGSGATLNTWKVYDGDERIPDMASTYYETNDATYELTGVQMELGTQATPFEHRSKGEETRLCQRYFYPYLRGTDNYENIALGYSYSSTAGMLLLIPPVEMRDTPSLSTSGTFNANDGGDDTAFTFGFEGQGSTRCFRLNITNFSTTTGRGFQLRSHANTTSRFDLSAEL